MLASAVPQELVLDPSSHLIYRAVAEGDDLKRIGDSQSVVEVGADARAIALGEIGRDHLDGAQEAARPAPAPAGNVVR